MSAFDGLSGCPAWVAWQAEHREGKNGRKVPYSPRGGEAATNDPNTWGTRAEAQARADKLPKPEGMGGVGLILGENIIAGEFVSGLDLDVCRDPANGKLEDWARLIIERFASYTEISPSGTGAKIFFRATLSEIESFRSKTGVVNGKTWSKPTGKRHPPAVELHLSRRYYAVTDDRIGTVDELRLVSVDDLMWLFTEAAPKLWARKQEKTFTQADLEDAFSLIPNNDLGWDDWNTRGMAIFVASGGADWGFAVFNAWSALSAKYDNDATAERWRTLHRSPPSQITVGSIVHWVRDVEPDWVPPSQRTGPSAGPPIFSDENVALRFADRHQQTLKYTALINKWHHWDGVRWQVDNTLYAFDLVRELCRSTSCDAPALQRSAMASAKKVAAVATLSRSDRRLVATTGQWDRDPWLLGTPGATVDLHTGALREPDLNDYMTKLTRAMPATNGCPLWESTMLEICGGDMDLLDYLQRIGGYFLTGVTREEKVFFLYGTGRNGKGVYIETIAHVLGEYATTVAMNTLMQTKHQEHPTEIAKLKGIRLAVASESMDGARWNAARIKLLTGGDALTGRFMRGDYFDFDPSHKLVVSSNRQPALGSVDVAIASRMELVPFSVTFAGREDKTLKDRLKAMEGPGILMWLIKGCVEWQRMGLATPRGVRAATDEYLKTQDDVETFLSDQTTRDQSTRVAVSSLYGPWQEWCQRTGAYCCSKKEFTQRLEGRGIRIERKGGNVAYAMGLRLGEPVVDDTYQREPGDDDDIPM